MGTDNITNIIKSMVPIKYKYSSKFRQMDTVFKSSCLESLLKSLDLKPKIHDQFQPSPDFQKHKNGLNINFQNSLNYIKELSDLRNLPLVLQYKNCLKDGVYNPDFAISPTKSNEGEKSKSTEREKRKKERMEERLKRLMEYRNSDNSLDPGKYHPNYESIRKKSPCVVIRKPAKKAKKVIKIVSPSKNNNISNSEDEENRKNSKRKCSSFDKSNEIEKNKENNEINSNNSSGISNNNTSIIPSTTLQKTNSNKNILKKYFKKNFMSLPKIKKSQKIFKLTRNRKIYKSDSMGNFSPKCSIIFNKTPGRSALFVDNNPNKSWYFPNYKSTLPHIPSIIFKHTSSFQDKKKYMTGKLLRNYKYSAEKYFVMEVAKTKRLEYDTKNYFRKKFW